MLGGAVLLFYCWKIGYFPKDVSVGDGLLFLLLAIAFGGVYLFFVVSLTSLGVFLRPIWHGLQNIFIWFSKVYERFTGKAISHTPFEIEKGGFELIVFAIIGAVLILGFGLSNIIAGMSLMLCAFACALFWSLYQQNSRKIDHLKRDENLTEDQSKQLKHLMDIQPFLLGAIIVIPLLIGGVSGKLLDGAMRIAKIRSDDAVVHIKEPYVKYVAEYGFKGQQSIFGEKFSKFEGVSVLFNGFGKNIVLEMRSENGSATTLVVPSDHIYISCAKKALHSDDNSAALHCRR